MSVEGSLDLFRLPEILQMIAQQAKTGILTVQGQDIVAVSFLHGRIVAADSLAHTVEEGLGQVLVGKGLLRNQEFARVAAESQSSGARLIDTLVERRLVTREQVLEGLREQMRRQLVDLLRWDRGDFKFYSGDEVSYEDGFLPISVEDLLLGSLEDLGEAPLFQPVPDIPEPPPLPELASARRSAPPLRAVPELAPELPSPIRTPRPAPAPTAGVAAQRTASLRAVPTPEGADRDSAFGPATAARPVGGESPLPRQFRKMELKAPRVLVRPWEVASACCLAALMILGVLGFLARRSSDLALSFPWEASDRAAIQREQRLTLSMKIDRAAKTFYLLEGRFPDGLAQLVDSGLLAPGDLEDPEGRPLQYAAHEESYSLEPLADGKVVPEMESSEGVSGNFLLDPQLLVPSRTASAPLVLLD